MTDDPFAATRAAVDALVATGARPAVAVAIDLGDEVVEAGAGPIDEGSLFYTFSAVKAVHSAATVQLADRGRLDLDATVESLLPGFGANGKEAITVRQLLAHRAGLPDGPYPDHQKREQIFWYYHRTLDQQLADIAALTPAWAPGTDVGYHGLTLQPLLSGIIEAVDGRPAPRYIAEEVFAPLGIDDFTLGLPADRSARRVKMVDLTPGQAYGEPLVYNTPDMEAWPCGGFTTARAFARVFRGLLDALAGRDESVWSPRAVAEMTFPHSAGQRDRRLGTTIPWGLGVLIVPPWSGGATPRKGLNGGAMFGPATPGAFGHAGNVFGSTAFADPHRDAAVVVLTNGLVTAETGAPQFIRLLGTALGDVDAFRAQKLR